jgi:glycosyltransferase involved in cell wall biosynthesis
VNPLVSVIVPVYNTSNRLWRCVNSLLSQEHSQLQIILVDDGSSDGSGDLCDDFARIDTRITVLHQSNGGSSSARNAGLQLARGEYIGFVDSDDWIENSAIRHLLECMSQSDLVVCGVTIDYAHPRSSYQVKPVLDEGLGRGPIVHALDDIGLLNYVWNKLYRRDNIERHGVRFRIGATTGEDLLFNCEYLRMTSSISTLSDTPYHYMREDQQGIAGRYDPNLMEKVVLSNSARTALYQDLSLTSSKHLRTKSYRYIENVQALVINECKAPNSSSASVASCLGSLKRDLDIQAQILLYIPRTLLDRVFLLTYNRLNPRCGAMLYVFLLRMRGWAPRLYSIWRSRLMHASRV